MWKLRTGLVCLIVGWVSIFVVCVLSLSGAWYANDARTMMLLIFLYLALAALAVYAGSEVLWQTLFFCKMVSIEKEAAEDIARKLRDRISEMEDCKNSGIRFEVSVSKNEGYGFIVDIKDLRNDRLQIFIRISLSHLVRHYSLCVPRRYGVAVINFHYFHRRDLLKEAGKEIGFLIGRVT
ncbi:MAG: hypothetical protein PHG66_03850 [Candidatus Colwellbacteria bacterium]|nr:hypothetical protein [Candidatus Colwellbacteria bacterium]